MLIYWLLFAYPALLALVYPADARGLTKGVGRTLAMAGFVVFYMLVAALRFEIGGDWVTYIEIYEEIEFETLGFALTKQDPLYAVINWLSAQFGMGIYLVNGICAFLLAVGVARVAMRFRDPWLAVTMAVPYLLIVVGMGYVRQGAAIGLLLLAIATFERGHTVRCLIYLAFAVPFHSTAVMVFPLFAYGLLQRNKFLAVIFGLVAVVTYFQFVVPRIAQFELGYLEAEYDSAGAATRIAMSAIPSILLLLRWRWFGPVGRVRAVWYSVAAANLVAVAALLLSPSSTAVDRAALFFSIVQIAVFGEFRNLIPSSYRSTPFMRIGLIGVAAAVQVVWLVYAIHATAWVPYYSIFDAG